MILAWGDFRVLAASSAEGGRRVALPCHGAALHSVSMSQLRNCRAKRLDPEFLQLEAKPDLGAFRSRGLPVLLYSRQKTTVLCTMRPVNLYRFDDDMPEGPNRYWDPSAR